MKKFNDIYVEILYFLKKKGFVDYNNNVYIDYNNNRNNNNNNNDNFIFI